MAPTCIFIACSDPRLNKASVQRDWAVRMIVGFGEAEVISLYVPGPTRLFIGKPPPSELEEICKIRVGLLACISCHLRGHRLQAAVFAGHNDCLLHPECDELATAVATQELQCILRSGGYTGPVLAAFETIKDGTWESMEMLPPEMQPDAFVSERIAA